MTTAKTRIFLNQRAGGRSDLQDTLIDAQNHGFDGVELDLPELGVTFGGKIITSALRATQKVITESGLGTCLHAPLSLNLLDRANLDLHMAVARACIDVTAELGGKVMVLHPGWVTPETLAAHRDALMTEEREHLHALSDHAQTRGVRLALENMPSLPADKAATLASYAQSCVGTAAQIAATDHPALMGCLDFSHAAIACASQNMDLTTEAHALAPHIGHIHLHDSFARPACVRAWTYEEGLTYGQGDTHLPLGWGNLDFTNTLSKLPVHDDTIITLEIQDLLHTPEALSESLEIARAVAKNLSHTFA